VKGKRQSATTKPKTRILLVASIFGLVLSVTNPAWSASAPGSDDGQAILHDDGQVVLHGDGQVVLHGDGQVVLHGDGQVVLQEQSARIDNAPSTQTVAPSRPTVHELKVTRDAERTIQAGVERRLAPSAQTSSAPSVQTSSAGSDVIPGNGQPASTDPLSALNGSSEASSNTILQGFAERDTSYGVCGITVSLQLFSKSYATILNVYPDLPASNAGLESGDTILSINGRSTRGIPSRAVWDWLTGRPGTTVDIVVERDGERIAKTLTRLDIGHIKNDNARTLFLTLFRKYGRSRLSKNAQDD
jgi:hypothetical protein